MELWQRLLDFIYPRRCPSCNAFLGNGEHWCATCLQKSILLRRLPLHKKEKQCICELYALGRYHGVLGKLIKELKYKGQRCHTKPLQTFVQTATKQLELPPIDIAFYVPLHQARYRERGFNQVELIFDEFVRQRCMTMGCLERCRPTKRQYELKLHERQLNLKKAFSLRQPDVQGKNCLLFDDVATTGATLFDCARLLRERGAANVYALVLASDR